MAPIFSALLFAAGVPVNGQDAPMATAPGPAVESLSPDEMNRFNKKKDMDRAMVTIREMFARGEYQAVITEIDKAKQIDPTNASLQLYRKWAEEKLIAAEAQPDASADTPGFGSSIGINPVHPPVSTGTPASGTTPAIGSPPGASTPSISATPSPTPTGVAVTTPAPEAPQATAKTSSSSRTFLIGAAILGLLVAVGAGASKFLVKRKSYVPAQTAAPEEEEMVFEPRGLLVPNPLTGEVNLSPEDIAANIEKSGRSTPANNEPPPTFDIYIPDPGEGERLPEDHENMPTMVESGDHMEEMPPDFGDAFLVSDPGPGLPPLPGMAAPDKVSETQSMSLPTEIEQHGEVLLQPGKSATTPSSASGSLGPGDTVSFEDLGIVLLSPGAKEPPPAAPAAPTPAPPSAPDVEEMVLSAPSAAPEPTPAPKPDTSNDPIRLDSIDFSYSNPGDVAKNDVRPAEQPAVEPKKTATGAIDLNALMKQTIDGGFAEPVALPPTSPVELREPAEASSISVIGASDGIDTLFVTPSASPEKSEADKEALNLDQTYGFSGDTFHSQDTIQMAPSNPDDDLSATKTYSGSNQTPVEPPAAIASEYSDENKPSGPPQVPSVATDSFYAATPPRGTAALDERSERMFREQYDRGIGAYDQKNWKQAVHYLSIASAIHPDNEEVRNKLREARDLKRKEEVKA